MVNQAIPPGRGEVQVERFLDHAGPQICPDLVVSLSLEDQRVAKTSLIEAQYQTSEFQTVMQCYLDSAQGKACSPSFDIAHAHNWDEVIQLAQLAEQKYLSRAKGFKGTHRRLFRFIGDHNAMINPWIGLLPNDSYFSVMCGGLKLILGAITYRTEVYVRISDTFNKLQDFQQKNERWAELYPDDLGLRDRATDTYTSFLVLIQGMICTLDDGIVRKIKDSLKKNRSRPRQSGDTTLEEKEKEFHGKFEDLTAYTNYLHKKDTSKTKHGVQEVQTTLFTHANYLSAIWTTSNKSQEGLERLSTELNDKFSILDEGVKYIAYMKNLLDQQIKKADYFAMTSQQQRPMLPAPRSNRIRENLLICLDYNEQEASREQSLLQDISRGVPAPSQSQMQELARHPSFSTFMTASKTQILHLVDLDDAYAAERFSPLSVLSRSLVDSILAHKAGYVIGYFCGLHQSLDDPSFGPSGLLKSLITQLLNLDLAYAFDLEWANRTLSKQQLRQGDLQQLLRLFTDLVQQLPPVPLFCILDGISLLATEELQQQSRQLVLALEETVNDYGLSAFFKVMLTSWGPRYIQTAEPTLFVTEPSNDSDDEEELYISDYNSPDHDGVALGGLRGGQRPLYNEAIGSVLLSDEFE